MLEMIVNKFRTVTEFRSQVMRSCKKRRNFMQNNLPDVLQHRHNKNVGGTTIAALRGSPDFVLDLFFQRLGNNSVVDIFFPISSPSQKTPWGTLR